MSTERIDQLGRDLVAACAAFRIEAESIDQDTNGGRLILLHEPCNGWVALQACGITTDGDVRASKGDQVLVAMLDHHEECRRRAALLERASRR